MVLAHNEAEHITACLDSLYAAEPQQPLEIFVLANGCTDDTEPIVLDYARKHSEVHLVSIALADKCNAWNVYIHETVPRHAAGYGVYFFMDGDARVLPGSLSAMIEGLSQNPRALAASAVPITGRNRQRDRQSILDDHGLVANLYALSGVFVRSLQDKQVKIPVGLEGDDGLIGALVKWNLDPRTNWDDARVVPCPKAGFSFDSLSWLRPRDWRTYWRRRIRYARRQYEFELIGQRLKASGLDGMPMHIRELYRDAAVCRIHWTTTSALFDWLALRAMQKQTSLAPPSA
jgi:glycosyltransferase involved in cell wall biosynthesis